MGRAKILVAGLAVAFIGLGWTAAAHADTNFRAGTDVTVSESQTLDHTLFASGNTVDVAGTVDGDVFCVGQNITITGTVNGDVICAGQSVSITGNVAGNIRAAGQTVTIGGRTERSLTVAGQSVTLDASGSVGGDATLAGQSITLNGSVGRDVSIAATAVTINGSVNRDVSATVTNLTLGGSSQIGGDLTYISRHDATQETGSEVTGSVSRQTPSTQQDNAPRFGALIGGGFIVALYMFIALLLVSLALILLFPQFIHDATEVAVAAPWKTLFVGLLSSILVPVILAVLMFTVVGIPLALLGALAWIIIVCISVPLTAYYIGSMLLSKSTTNPVWSMLLGTAIVLILYMIPFVGFLTWLIGMWFGLGIILQQFPRLPRPRYSTVR